MLTTDRAKAVAQLDRARAVEAQAALNLSYTQISAPVEAARSVRALLRVGQFVQAGTQLMAGGSARCSLCGGEFLKAETHALRGCARRPAGRNPDRQFPWHPAEGPRRQPVAGERSRIARCRRRTMPPATSPKIVQRVPVKIVLDDHRLTGLLRPGMSAEPTIDTKATALAEREPNTRPASHLALARSNGG